MIHTEIAKAFAHLPERMATTGSTYQAACAELGVSTNTREVAQAAPSWDEIVEKSDEVQIVQGRALPDTDVVGNIEESTLSTSRGGPIVVMTELSMEWRLRRSASTAGYSVDYHSDPCEGWRFSCEASDGGVRRFVCDPRFEANPEFVPSNDFERDLVAWGKIVVHGDVPKYRGDAPRFQEEFGDYVLRKVAEFEAWRKAKAAGVVVPEAVQ